METPIKMDDLGYPYFRKHAYLCSGTGCYFSGGVLMALNFLEKNDELF